MYLGLHLKCPIFLYDFNQIWNFSTDLYENPQCYIRRKPLKSERELMGAERKTDMKKGTRRFLVSVRTRLKMELMRREIFVYVLVWNLLDVR